MNLKTRSTTSSTSFGDPRRFQPAKAIPFFRGTQASQRVTICGLVRADMCKHPLLVERSKDGKPVVVGHLNPMWERLRSVRIDPDNTVESALSSPEAVSAVTSLESFVTFLLEMRDRRQELVDELNWIDSIEQDEPKVVE